MKKMPAFLPGKSVKIESTSHKPLHGSFLQAPWQNSSLITLHLTDCPDFIGVQRYDCASPSIQLDKTFPALIQNMLYSPYAC